MIKKIEVTKKLEERNEFKNIENNEIFYQKNQTFYINKLFLDDDFSHKSLLIKELERKISSYKQQDKQKNIFNKIYIINLSELIEKLVSSKLKCKYCKVNIFLFYKNIKDDYQWTLDRIDNDIGHSCENTLISCLKCNLQRRRRSMEAFKFTKELRIKKSS